MKKRTLLFAIVTTVCMSACDESRSDLRADQQTLNDYISLWQRSNIASYQYIFRRQCYCMGGDIVVVVINGRVSQAFRSPSGTFLTPQELNEVFPIEGLFTRVQEAIDQRVASLSVTYNATFGYPETISIDPNLQAVDDEITYTARNLQ